MEKESPEHIHDEERPEQQEQLLQYHLHQQQLHQQQQQQQLTQSQIESQLQFQRIKEQEMRQKELNQQQIKQQQLQHQQQLQELKRQEESQEQNNSSEPENEEILSFFDDSKQRSHSLFKIPQSTSSPGLFPNKTQTSPQVQTNDQNKNGKYNRPQDTVDHSSGSKRTVIKIPIPSEEGSSLITFSISQEETNLSRSTSRASGRSLSSRESNTPANFKENNLEEIKSSPSPSPQKRRRPCRSKNDVTPTQIEKVRPKPRFRNVPKHPAHNQLSCTQQSECAQQSGFTQQTGYAQQFGYPQQSGYPQLPGYVQQYGFAQQHPAYNQQILGNFQPSCQHQLPRYSQHCRYPPANQQPHIIHQSQQLPRFEQLPKYFQQRLQLPHHTHQCQDVFKYTPPLLDHFQETSDYHRYLPQYNQNLAYNQQLTSQTQGYHGYNQQFSPKIEQIFSLANMQVQQISLQNQQVTLPNAQVLNQSQQTLLQSPQIFTQTQQVSLQSQQILTQTQQVPLQNPQVLNQSQQTLLQSPQIFTQTQQVPLQSQQILTQTQQVPLQNRQVLIHNQQVPLQNRQVLIHNQPFVPQNQQFHAQNQQVLAQSQQLPTHSQQHPVDSQQLHVRSQQLPTHSQQHPVDSQQLPVHSQQLHVRSQQLPTHSQQHHVDSQQLPTHCQQHPTHIHQLAAHTQQHHTQRQQVPLEIQQLSIQNQHSQLLPTQRQQVPFQIQQLPVQNQQYSTQTQQFSNENQQSAEKLQGPLEGTYLPNSVNAHYLFRPSQSLSGPFKHVSRRGTHQPSSLNQITNPMGLSSCQVAHPADNCQTFPPTVANLHKEESSQNTPEVSKEESPSAKLSCAGSWHTPEVELIFENSTEFSKLVKSPLAEQTETTKNAKEITSSQIKEDSIDVENLDNEEITQIPSLQTNVASWIPTIPFDSAFRMHDFEEELQTTGLQKRNEFPGTNELRQTNSASVSIETSEWQIKSPPHLMINASTEPGGSVRTKTRQHYKPRKGLKASINRYRARGSAIRSPPPEFYFKKAVKNKKIIDDKDDVDEVEGEDHHQNAVNNNNNNGNSSNLASDSSIEIHSTAQNIIAHTNSEELENSRIHHHGLPNLQALLH